MNRSEPEISQTLMQSRTLLSAATCAVVRDTHAADRPATVGRELHGGGRWYFDGERAEVVVTNAVLTGQVPAQPVKPERFDGRATSRELAAPTRSKTVSVGAGIKLVGASKADDLPGQPREVAVMPRAVGADGSDSLLQPGAPVTLATPILSDSDAKNPAAAAQELVTRLTRAKTASLSTQHRAWWAAFWSRSFIAIPDPEIERRWYAALSVMGSCSRPGKVAPGLWGDWLATDAPNWHADFHLNDNFQAPFYIVYAANHADLSLPFYQAIWESVPHGRAMARRRGWQGVHFPVCIGPWGLSPEDADGDLGQRSNAAYTALNFIWYGQYAQDRAWLKATGYPHLREVGEFWEDCLEIEKGRYVICKDAIHEGSGDDMNPILSLGLVRTLFGNLLARSPELGVDADKRAKWRDILDRLSAFPTQERGGKTVFRQSERGTAWFNDNTLGIQHIFPAGAVGLDSDPKLLAISRNMIDAMARWHDSNGFSSWYTACARVGYDPKMILANVRKECDRCSMPSLVLTQGGGGVENVSGFLAVNEMLMPSHEGVIRFFPVWPKEQNARFGRLRAVSACLVSAELENGVVRGVRIHSERGRAWTLQSPWPAKQVQLCRNGRTAELVTGERFTFATHAGEIIQVDVPER